jgi:hypothetical protein
MQQQNLRSAAQVAQQCQAICIDTIQYCLKMGGAHADPAHIKLLQDCADICESTAKFMLRDSPQHDQVTSACADICDLCAESCEKFTNDAQMKACADVCRACAAACRAQLA